jgi:integrase
MSEVAILRDKRSATPGAADNLVKTIRAMYAWGIEHGYVEANPAVGIGKINPGGGGAVPWSVEDLRQYRQRHPKGTMAHLALTLFMFTAARISDVVILGRGHEIQRKGMTWLDFQPTKKGAKRVRIPMLPPLFAATRDGAIVGKTYLLTEYGKPFASAKAFANKFAGWCEQAKLVDAEGKVNRSSHGIRKAAGELLALEGASQYQIMAIHGHASAKTSEIYTEGVNRDELASQAMALLASMDW